MSDATSPKRGKSPDYVLQGLNKKTDERAKRLGVAWLNADGSITLVLNRFVTLPTDPEWLYTLFPER